ncbi:MAG TPA: SPASM domain-containing protein, partial [Chryseosolibacter sp.]
GRCVLQKSNFREFPNIITTAEDLGLDQISFLAADVSTTAFNRQESWSSDKVSGIALSATETKEFEEIVSGSFEKFGHQYRNGFIAESPRKMFELVQYYRALSGNNQFPVRRCNAQWVSAVVEADGEVRPCFFHASYGNIHDAEFIDILNSSKAVRFRKSLNMEKDPICTKCVCSLHVPLNA